MLLPNTPTLYRFSLLVLERADHDGYDEGARSDLGDSDTMRVGESSHLDVDASSAGGAMNGQKPIIFVGSSSDRDNETLAATLGKLLTTAPNSFHVQPWRITEEAGEYFLETLLRNTDKADFAVLLLTPDDRTTGRGETRWAPRDNVIFELGLFMGKLGRKRVLMVCPEGDLKIPSDLDGIQRVKYDPSDGEPRVYLWPAAEEVKTTFVQQLPDGHQQAVAPMVNQNKFEQGNLIVNLTATSSGKPIAIYRDQKTSLDWFSEFAFQIQNLIPALHPRLLYYAPSGAKFWRRASRGALGQIAIKQAFVDNYRQVLGELKSPALNLIDLGVGDFEKGRLLLDYYMEKNSTVNYFPLDISYDMIELALHDDEEQILSRVMEKVNVIGIHAAFANLREYKHLFERRSHPNIFLLLGNTLGNELSENDTLNDIKDGMYPGDILFTELQLIEEEPKSLDELTISIQPTKYFYAGPFASLGFDINLIDVRFDLDMADPGSKKYGTMTYKISCNFSGERREINHPAFEGSPLRIRRPSVVVAIVRKYQEDGISTIFKEAGFEVLNQHSTEGTPPHFRRFHYITARKPK
jgi:predicted nucleotide-binding protein